MFFHHVFLLAGSDAVFARHRAPKGQRRPIHIGCQFLGTGHFVGIVRVDQDQEVVVPVANMPHDRGDQARLSDQLFCARNTICQR